MQISNLHISNICMLKVFQNYILKSLFLINNQNYQSRFLIEKRGRLKSRFINKIKGFYRVYYYKQIRKEKKRKIFIC